MARSRIGSLFSKRRGKRKPPGRRKRLFYEVLERRRLLAVVNWDGGGDGTSFLDGLNWDTDTVPGAVDDAVINVAGSDPTITVNGSASVNSLVTQEAIRFSSGTFTVGTTAEVNAAATISGATIVGAHFIGTGSLVVNSSDGTLDGVTLGVDTTLIDGAQVTVHNDLFLDGSTLRLERVSGSLPTDFDVGLNFDGGSQTLGGSGTVELFNNRNAAEERHTRIRPISGDLTIGAGITLQNDVNSFFTTVGDPALPIVLEGTVAPQTTKPDYTNNALRIVGSTVTNHGTISVTTGLVDAADHLINQGSIEVSGGVLNLNGDWLNGSGGTIYQTAGTIQLGGNFVASDLGAFSGTGGTVSIVGTLLDPGATLAIDSERTWQLAGGTIQGVTIIDDNDGDAAGTLRVTSADGTLDGVKIDVDSLLVPGALVTALNDLTVNGTMTLQTTSSGTTGVEFASGAAQTLGGTGTVVLSNNWNDSIYEYSARLRPTNGSSLTIGPDMTVRTASNSRFATLGDPTLPLIIEGTVSSESPGYTLRVTGSTVSNTTGTLQAVAGELQVLGLSGNVNATSIVAGDLDLDGSYTVNQAVNVPGGSLTLRGDWINASTIDQSGGTINLLDTFTVADTGRNQGRFSGTGGTVSIIGSLLDPGATLAIDSERTWQLAGGTIQGVTIVDDNDGDAAGTLRVTSADGTLDGVTIDVDSLLVPGALVTALNDLTVNGTMTLQTTSVGTTGVEFGSGTAQTLGGTGTVVLLNNWNDSIYEYSARLRPTNGGSLTIGPDMTVRTASNSRFATLGDPTLPLIIEGTVSSESPGYTLRVTGSTVSNTTGTLQAVAGELQVLGLSGNVNATSIVAGGLDLDGSYTINQPVNVPGGSLTLRGDWINASTIDQSGGTINLLDTFTVADTGRDQGRFNGTGGTVSIVGSLLDPGATLAIDSERTWQLAGGTIQGVTIVDDNDGDAAGTLRVTSADGTLDGVTIDVDSLLVPGALVTALNDLTVNGTMTLQTTSSGTTGVEFASGAAQTLGGTGTVVLSNNWNDSIYEYSARLRPTNGSSLTIGPDMTVRTASNSRFATLGDPTLPLIIEGTVSSESPGYTLRVTGSTVSNTTGTLQAVAGELQVLGLSGNVNATSIVAGGLDLDGSYTINQPVNVPGGSLTLRGDWINASTIDQSGGTINLLDTFTVADTGRDQGRFSGTGGTVSIVGSLLDPGATLAIDSERTWQLAGGTIQGVTIIDDNDGDAAGTLRVTSADGTLDGVTIDVDSLLVPGALVTAQNDLTVNGTMTLQTTSSGTTGVEFASGTSQTLGGTGTVVLSNTWNTNEFEYAVRLRPTNGGSLTIGPDMTVRNASNTHFATLGNPDLQLTIEGTVLSTSSGRPFRITASSLTNTGTAHATAGLLDIRVTPTNFTPGIITGGTWHAQDFGDIRVPAGNNLNTISANVILDGPNAVLQTGAGVDSITGVTAITAVGGLTLLGGHNFTSVGDFQNDGLLSVGSGTNFVVPAGDVFTSRGSTVVNGTLSSDAILVESGTLSGSGLVAGPITADGTSIVSPGESPGILNVTDFELQVGSTLLIETGGTIVGVDYDQLNVEGTVTLAGELDIDIINTIAKGTEFTIIDNDGVDPIVGTFAGIPEGSVIDNGYDEYVITYSGGDGNDVVLTALTDVRAVVNTLDSGAGSLRGELTSANAISDPVAVIFLIPGSGPHTISPASPLPAPTGKTFIDATTQLTYAGAPLVEVEGSSAGPGDGFVFGPGSDGSLLRGLVINRWQEDGVQIDGANNIHIGANYIGTSIDGLADLGNGEAGIDVYNSRRSSIGSYEPGEGNLISGNDGPGVDIQFRSSAISVEGNWIGVDASGSGDLGNSLAGVVVRGTGVAVDSPHDNFIGQVGGAVNVISGNDQEGVLITGTGVTGNLVVNNFVGLDSSGSTVLANSREGVLITGAADGNTVGLAGAGNTISGTINPFAGVSLQSDHNVVQANRIGTDVSGTVTLGGYRGIEVTNADNLIGGRSFGDGNTIRGMDVEGIVGVPGNTVLSTSVADSGNLIPSSGISLTAAAPSPPVIDLSVSGFSTTRVGGTFAGTPNTIYRIEVFANTVLGFGGTGDTETYLGFVNVATNDAGNVTWNFSTPILVPVGRYLSATATSEVDGTSRLAASVITRPSRVVTNTGDSGAGSLRQAILDANAVGGGDLIEFNIAGVGPHTITPTSLLPIVGDRLVLDGRSEPDFVSQPVVELDGSATTGIGINFQSGSEGSSLLGLVVGGFSSDGVRVNASDVTIAGNFIGLDVTGASANPNQSGVNVVNGPRTQIGGSTLIDRNVISGNTNNGINVGSGSGGSRVQGNLVGLSVDETLAIPNANGIRLSGASDVLVGTDGNGFGDAGESNIVAGNTNAGVIANGATGSIVAGNKVGIASDNVTVFVQAIGIAFDVGSTATRIGTDGDGVSDHVEGNTVTGSTVYGIGVFDSSVGTIAGNFSFGNAGAGVTLSGTTDLTVGGTLQAQRNVLSGNQYGLVLSNLPTTNNRVFGNYIGLDPTGSIALPNTDNGIYVLDATGNYIGTDGDGVDDELEGNVIAGNTQQDILVEADGNVIAGNYIATDASGLTAIGSGLSRIVFRGDNNRLGTDSDGVSDRAERNIIGGGMLLEALSTSNTIAGNYFGVGADGITLLETPTVTPRLTLSGTLHTVGGPTAAARNVFTEVVDFLGGDNITFQNNYVGVLPDGETAITTSYLQLDSGASGNQIGGDADGEGNVITRVVLTDAGTDGNTLEGNLIGLNASGTDGLGIDEGVVIVRSGASGNFIGTPSAGNVIASAKSGVPTTFRQIGVTIRDAGTDNNRIQNNIIGLNPSGDAAIGNDSGITVTGGASGTIIGGLGAGEGNVISASLGGSGRGRGIVVNAAVNTTIEGNLIGTDLTGTVDFGNTSHGIQDQFGSTGTVIRGNVISGNQRSGITLGTGQTSGAVAGETIVGNLIGTDITGQSAIPNDEYGVWLIGVNGNTVGGPTVADRNLISGNTRAGIQVNGNPTDSNGNTIQNNYIGLNLDGDLSVPNGNGIELWNAAANVLSNVISGNLYNGIEIQNSSGADQGAIVQGNIIGLDVTGTVDFGGNGANGIRIVDSPNNLIGGTTPTARNVISGNDQNGIVISEQSVAIDALNNQIVGNYIGTDLTGTVGLGNSLSGIVIDPTVSSARIGITVGGDIAGNVIGGNNGDGIAIDSASGIDVVGNLIGTTATGIGGIPNIGNGINISSSSDVSIGGVAAGAGNRIAFNLGDGTRVTDATSLVFNRGNEVFNNGGLGIDLGVDGVTLNDLSDLDGVQNFPQLDSVLAGSQTLITGSITSTANTTLQIDFYGNDAPDVTLFGEGQRYLGSTQVVTDNAGGATFNVNLSVASFGGEFITATATGAVFGTSEFSAALQANSNAPPTIVQDSLLVTIIDKALEEATYGIPTLVVDEGQELSLTGDFADVDSSPLVTINWGDGTTTTDPIIRKESFSARKVFLDDDPSVSPSNLYPVLVRVTDADGSGSAFIAITVRNVDPIITQSALSAALVGEGQPVTLAGTFDDPGTGDYHYLQVDWGDGTGNQQFALPRGNRSFNVDHVYADDGDYDVRYSLFDDDRDPALPRPGEPEFSYDSADTVRVFNTAPTASINVESNAVQGQSVRLSATVTDPGAADTIRYEWLIEQAGEGVVSSTSPEFLFTPQVGGIYDVLLTVRDDEHASFSTTAQIEVDNDAPTILPRDITLSVDGVATNSTEEGKTVSLSGRFIDGGERDIHTATIDFGDGSAPVIVVVEYGDRGFKGIQHTYADDPAGPNDNYLITVTVSDGIDSTQAVVPFEVRNAAPSVSIQSDRITDTNVRLVANIDDAGFNDAHTLEWFVNGVQVPGSRVVSIPRPSGTSLDVLFRATDEDGGSASTTATFFVLDDDNNRVVITESAGQVNVSIDGGLALPVPLRDQILVAAGGGNDLIIVDPAVTANVQVDAGSGNDTVITAGGNDTLIGGPGSDELRAGAGDDVLVSVEGNDLLDGGLGNDEYRFIRFSDKQVIDDGGIDLLNFEAVEEGSGTANGISIDLSVEGTTQNVHSTGTITLFGQFENVTGSLYNDNLSGNDADNELYGGPGDDTLAGAAGSNTVAGGDGDDTIFGGPGNESLIGGSGNDSIDTSGDPILGPNGDTIFSSGGDDTIIGGVGNDYIVGSIGNSTIDGGEDNDTIFGGPGNESLIGGGGNDTIVGQGDSTDTIYGGPGNDSLTGGGRGDSIIGGDGNDTIFGGNGGGGQLIGGIGDDVIVAGDGNDDSIFGGPGNDSLGGTGGSDTIAGDDGDDTIFGGPGNESLLGGGGNDSIVDGVGADSDTIFGGPGNDSLIGGGGTDTIDGGEGNDTIYGGPGNESLSGGTGSDTIVDGSGPGNDTIFGGPGNDSLVGAGGADSIDGGEGDDTIYGGPGDETLSGGGGSDTIIDGAGNDTIFGGPGNDSLVGGSGNDTIAGGEDNDTIFGGPGNESLDGGSGDDTIVDGGGDGTDTIFGGPGNDSLIGGGGNDTIAGDAGDDTIYGGPGNESLDGGAGNDTIVDSGGSSDDTIFGGPGNDSLIGSGGRDTIMGGDGDDTIFGGPGDESILGGSGNDTIIDGTGPGIDTIFGGPGNDSLTGGGGNDIIDGGDGNDTIFGGPGNESLSGGAGDDTIVDGGGDSIDTIFGGPGNDSLIGSGGRDTIIGGDDDDTIFGGPGNESIDGGAGNDTIIDGPGSNDTIFGGPGDDSIYGTDGIDSILGGDGNDTIFGGADGGELIDGGPGNDNLSSGGGADDTLYGAAGSDLLIADGTSVKIFGDTDISNVPSADDRVLIEADANITLSTSGNQSTLLVNGELIAVLTDLNKAVIAGGPGDNVLDASGFAGDAALFGLGGNDTLLGGVGNDTLEGGAGNDSLVGGGGNDVYRFSGKEDLGADTIDEAVGPSADKLDFYGLQSGVQIDLASDQLQTVAPGILQLQLTSGVALEDVTGTAFSDRLYGNDLNNKLIGGGGLDRVVGRAGDDWLSASRTRYVYLDFDSATDGDDHVYTIAERDAIQARMEQDFAQFDVMISQTPPIGEVFITAIFNSKPVIRGLAISGGIADRVGFRDVDRGGVIQIDVNGFLGDGTNLLRPDPENYIALSSTIASHELIHMYGSRHHDAFGALGEGVFAALGGGALLPDYGNTGEALETADHLIASPASVRTTLTDALANPYMGERESLKMAYLETGDALFELEDGSKDIVAPFPYPVQPLGALKALTVPNTLENTDAANYGIPLDAAATSVIGSIKLDGIVSESDFYSFDGQTGDAVTIEVLSFSLRSRIANTIDSLVRVFDAGGNKIDYYLHPLGAFNDDGIEPTDSILLDLILPTTGTFYVEVDTFSFLNNPEFSSYLPDFDADAFCVDDPDHIGCTDTDTGDYELLIYRVRQGVGSALGDSLVGGAGSDTLVSSSGRDFFLADQDDTFAGPGDPETVVNNTAPTLEPIADQTVDEGQTMQFDARGSDNDPGDEITYALLRAGGTLPFPTGATIDPTTGGFSWTPQDDGVFEVLVAVADLHGVIASDSVTITVNNTDVSARIDSISGLLQEGSPITIEGSGHDPTGVATTITLNLDVFRGTQVVASEAGIETVSLTFQPADDGDYNIVLTATSDSGQTDITTQTISVANVDPIFEAGANEFLPPAAAGVFSRSLSFEDPGEDTWIGTVDFGDGSPTQDLAIDQVLKTFDLGHTYAADGTFTVRIDVSDEDGGSSSDTFDVQVQRNTPPTANDDLVTTGESTPLTINVLDNDIDPENNIVANQTINLTSPAGGTLTNNQDGTFSFDPDGFFESLGANDSARVSFLYQVEDAFGETSTASVEIEINGENDKPTISGDHIGALTEDGSGDSGTLGISDPDADESVFQTQSGMAGTYGALDIDAAGNWNYTRTADLQSMNDGDVLIDSFTVWSADGTANELITITISGLNDDAAIGGDNAGAMTEDEAGDSGVLTVSDPDEGEAVFLPRTNVAGNYGSFSIDGAGNWSYTRTADLGSMKAGELLNDAFTVDSADGTASEQVIITINGLNDVATISGDNAGSISEDSAGDSGTLAVSDLDEGENAFQSLSSQAGTYGNFSIDAAGNWNYARTVDLQSMKAGDTLVDSFTVFSVDGSASELVTIMINGLNDNASISGDNAGALTEDQSSDSGILSVGDIDEGESLFQPQIGQAGNYGDFSIDASGNWRYTRSANLNSMNEGDVLTESFPVLSVDGTAMEEVTVTIIGLNDNALISGEVSGSMTEDQIGDAGSLAISDPDSGEDLFQTQTATAGTYGTFNIDAMGNWSYTRTADLDSMNAGDMLTDSFAVLSADGTASEQIAITISGVNDNAAIGGDNLGSMTEDASGDSGTLSVSDLDDGEDTFQTQSEQAGSYGIFSVNETGNWTYTRTAELNSMNAGEILTDSFTVMSADGTASELVKITISGLNDNAIITGDSTAAITEDDSNTSRTLIVEDADQGEAVFLPQAETAGNYGSFTIDATGVWSYTRTSDLQSMNAGDVYSDTFTASSADGSISVPVTITINGLNDDANIIGDNLREMTEDDTAVTGVLTVHDVDEGENAVQPRSGEIGIYGNFSIDASGNWTYTRTADLQFMVEGEVLADEFTVTSVDSSASQSVTIQIYGLNDLGAISGDTTALMTEDDAGTSGKVNIIDADQGEATFQAQSGAVGEFGTFEIDSAGNWDYTRVTDLQSMNFGDVLTDSFMISSTDGTATAQVNITITGLNDDAAISGDNAGVMTEDEMGTGGVLANSDPDDGEDQFQARSNLAGDFGFFSIDVAGNWSYTRTANLDSLNAGDALTEAFTVRSADGTASEQVTITINGLNDTATINGEDSGTLTEDGVGATGKLAVSDLDEGENTFQSQVDTMGSFGNFSIDLAGIWSYTRTANLNAMNAGDVLTDFFSVLSSDGTASKQVAITVNGANDAATISGEDSGALTEDEAGTTGTIVVSDVDEAEDVFRPLIGTTGSYGNFSIDVLGTWSYIRTANLDSMNAGDVLTDAFAVLSADGTASKQITITINGLNDAATISGELSGALTEDGVGTTGTIAILDVDEGENAFQSQVGTIGSYGNFSIDATGTWSYTRTANLNSMKLGDILSESFSVRSADGTASEQVTITINGLNDNATISGDNAGAMTEDDAGDSGLLLVSDADQGEGVFQSQVNTAGSFGTFSIDAMGNWSYTRASDLQSMNAGDVLNDTFTVVSADGTASRQVTVRINGLNDEATISGDNTGDMTEDDLNESGALTVNDVDEGENIFQNVTLTGTYGNLTIDATGTWIYTLTADLQSLSDGDVVTDTFSVGSVDGTASEQVTIAIRGLGDDVSFGQIVETVIETVADLINASGLSLGQGNSLITKLTNANVSFEQGRTRPAINQLNAFTNQVEALIRTGRLDAVIGQELLDQIANAILLV